MEPEAIDDAQLLSAIERAWPIPPMTGQLINRDVSSLAVEPDTSSFSAPLAMPRIKSRRTWSSLTRIAAVLALLLTSVFGVIAFNNRSEDDSMFSIAAPSPFESACTLPIRSRAELVAIVNHVKDQQDRGTQPGATQTNDVSIFELTAVDAETRASLKQFYSAVFDCSMAGVVPFVLEAYNPAGYQNYIAYLLENSDQNVESVVSQLLMPNLPDSRYQWVQPDLSIYGTAEGDIVGTEQVNILGDSFGMAYKRDGNSWIVEGSAFVRGEWSSLVITGALRDDGCGAASIKSDEALTQQLKERAWVRETHPLVAIVSTSWRDVPEVDAAVETAVRDVVDAFRLCLLHQVEPYRFVQTTDAFFGSFANVLTPGSTISIDDLDALGLFMSMPSVVTSVVPHGEDRVLAMLAVNQEWLAVGKAAAIILIKQDGKWLIDQLAIVEGAST
ncbi:hypothetical protein BH09CHL1_BH09CHL1_09470 [soil metagenome]